MITNDEMESLTANVKVEAVDVYKDGREFSWTASPAANYEVTQRQFGPFTTSPPKVGGCKARGLDTDIVFGKVKEDEL